MFVKFNELKTTCVDSYCSFIFFCYITHETYKSVHNLKLADSYAFSPTLISVKPVFNNPKTPKPQNPDML